MPKKISIIIEESLEFLEKSYSKVQGALKKDRIKTLIFVKSGQYYFQSDIAKKLGRTEKTIRDWLQELKEEIQYGALYSHCKRKLKSKLKVSRKSHYKKEENAEAFFKKP